MGLLARPVLKTATTALPEIIMATMKFRVTLESTEPYLEVRAEGPAPLSELCALTTFVGELCNRGRQTRLLADLSGVEPKLTFTEHLQFAALVASLLGRLEFVAAVVPPDYLDAPAARAAKLAGLNVKTFLQRAEAVEWLA